MDITLLFNIVVGIVMTLGSFLLKLIFDRTKDNSTRHDALAKEVNSNKAEASDKIVSSMRAMDKKIEELHITDIEKQLSTNTADINWLKHDKGN